MCGVAGLVRFDGAPRPNEWAIAMRDQIRHRGPDDDGVWADGHCTLVHTRLAVLDLSGSRQPMQLDEPAVALTFNGEIYNYRDLGAQLERGGVHLTSRGDTEVLLRIIAAEGTDGLSRLRGMFAFGYWDAARRSLLIARDPLGKKPLFWTWLPDGTFAFASEIKALLCLPGADRGIDEAGLRQALRFRATYGDRTLYRDIFQLRPGFAAMVEAGRLTLRRHFDLVREAARHAEHSRSPDEIVHRIQEAADLRLVADVPIGIFLSGGVDSTLVASLTAEGLAQRGRLCTYSVGFESDVHSELGVAEETANRLGAEYTSLLVTPAMFEEHLPRLTRFRDAPLGEPADVAIGLLSERAKRDVTVVLSGEGADETFAGYPKYGFANWGRNPPRAAALASRALLSIGLGGRLPRRLRIAADVLAQDSEVGRLARWFDYLGPDALAMLFPNLGDPDAWRAAAGEHETALGHIDDLFPLATPLQRMQLVDSLTWLPGNMLERGDRMTMAFGLEARMPFMDSRLAPEAIGLPDRAKVNGQSKKPLRDLLRIRMGELVAQRRKWGFRVPLDRWFRAELRDHVRAVLLGHDSLCQTMGDIRAVDRLITRHEAGEDHALALWILLAAEHWFRGRGR